MRGACEPVWGSNTVLLAITRHMHRGRDSEQQLPPVCRVLVVTMVTCVAPEHWSIGADHELYLVLVIRESRGVMEE